MSGAYRLMSTLSFYYDALSLCLSNSWILVCSSRPTLIYFIENVEKHTLALKPDYPLTSLPMAFYALLNLKANGGASGRFLAFHAEVIYKNMPCRYLNYMLRLCENPTGIYDTCS